MIILTIVYLCRRYGVWERVKGMILFRKQELAVT